MQTDFIYTHTQTNTLILQRVVILFAIMTVLLLYIKKTNKLSHFTLVHKHKCRVLQWVELVAIHINKYIL